MRDCNMTHTPMESGLKLCRADEEEDIDATRFRRNVGCLRYLLHTRPNLSFTVGVLSRYMSRPKVSNESAMKHCLRYLKGSTSLGLVFNRSTPSIPRLVGYSDFSYNTDPYDGKSTTGHIFYLNDSMGTWCSQTGNCCIVIM